MDIDKALSLLCEKSQCIGSLNALIDTLKAKIASLEAGSSTKELEAVIVQLDREKRETDAENQALKVENQALKAENQALKVENQAIKAENQAHEAEFAKLTSMVADFQAQIGELTSQVAQAIEHETSATASAGAGAVAASEPAATAIPAPAENVEEKPAGYAATAVPAAANMVDMVETKLNVEKPSAVPTPGSPPAFRVVKTKTYSLSQATSNPDALLRVAKAFAFTGKEENRGINVAGMTLGDVISHLFFYRANKSNGKVIPFFRWVETNKPELTDEGRSLIPWLIESEQPRDVKAVAAFDKFLNTNKEYMKA